VSDLAKDRSGAAASRTGLGMYADIESGYRDLRINELVAGATHWVQQEAPQQTNAVLERFVRSLGEPGI